MQLFIKDYLDRGIPPDSFILCSACQKRRPRAGAIPYGCYLLCNRCAVEFEVARVADPPLSIGRYIRDKHYGEGERYVLSPELFSTAGQAAQILIVDSDDGNRNVLEALLVSAGYVVQSTSTGHAALQQVALHRPDLVIADFRLPDMTSTELMSRLQAHGCDIPLLLVTGNISPEARRASLRAAGYLLKPYDIDGVLEAVSSLLERSFAR
jgi:CheY-like chemotaxis protein